MLVCRFLPIASDGSVGRIPLCCTVATIDEPLAGTVNGNGDPTDNVVTPVSLVLAVNTGGMGSVLSALLIPPVKVTDAGETRPGWIGLLLRGTAIENWPRIAWFSAKRPALSSRAA